MNCVSPGSKPSMGARTSVGRSPRGRTCECCLVSHRAIDDTCQSTARPRRWRPPASRSSKTHPRLERASCSREQRKQRLECCLGGELVKTPSQLKRTGFCGNLENECTHIPSVTFQHTYMSHTRLLEQNLLSKLLDNHVHSCRICLEVSKC